MRRVHWFEIHDSSWCPSPWRRGLQEFMSWFAVVFHPYEAIAGRLREAVERSGAAQIVDLCSGAGAPAMAVQATLRKCGLSIPLILTDKYPHPDAGHGGAPGEGADLRALEKPVDALALPADLLGFRTLFTAFHHFAPAQARGILADAAERGQGIGIFEYTERRFSIWGPALLMTPLLVWICTPVIRPFRWSRLLWTYLLPVIPAMAVWDGLVSCLRTYSPEELNTLTWSIGGNDYRWEIGRVPSFGGCWITYCLGWPEGTGAKRPKKSPPAIVL